MWRKSGSPSPAAVPDAGEARAQLAAILSSRRFRRAGIQKDLLRYLVEAALEGRNEAIDERAVGMAVFDRDETFDPKTDGVVRVVMERLRRNLSKYYSHRRYARVMIEFPKGEYAPVIAWRRSKPLTRRPLFWVAALAALAAVAMLAVRMEEHRVTERSVSILPFYNVTGSPDADPLIRQFGRRLEAGLSRSKGLRLIPLAAGNEPDQRAPAGAVARSLSVDTLLTGTLSNLGGDIRITVKLVNGSDGRDLWTEVYDGPLEILPAVESDIVWAVAHALASTDGR